MRIGDAFPSQFLKASDLGGNVVGVTISGVKTEAVGREKELKLVVYFEGKQKGMVLNKTNARKIAELAGSDETENWTGVKVALYGTEVEFNGDTVEAIRVRAANRGVQAPPPPRPVAVDVPVDDIPF